MLPTAKILLYIALTVGPQNPPLIYATSQSEGYVWTSSQSGWTLLAKGFPSSDFTRDPARGMTFSGGAPVDSVPAYLRAISRHDWSHNSAMVFDNGDRVEKHGDHAFYIINAGGANQKVFTILFSPSQKS
ncbi:MAG: hypothetical protein LV480_08040 [Methylacidiphilales bacterium]|nr:hypothetical protein [Candidatus Methylacidiphilales bacterium]